MQEGWKTYKLGDIATLQRGFDLPTKNRVDGLIPIIAASGIGGYHNVFKVKGPGVITGRSGTIGKVMYEEDDFWPLNTSLWVKNFHGNDKRFVYYLLKNFDLTKFNNGTSVPTLNRNDVHSVELAIPPLQEQKAIASILSALDDKIELNLEMNKTLEEMAMTLYKHWFVDFGPFQDGEFVDSELGKVPKGWEVKEIGKAVDTLGGGTPRTKVQEYWVKGAIDWYSPTDLTRDKSLYSLGAAKKITDLGLQKSSAKLFPIGSLLMSSRATIGALTINRKIACTNQGFITMIPNEKFSVYQLHGWVAHNMSLIMSKANGSTFKEISKSNFRGLKILESNDAKQYNVLVEKLYLQIENNIVENQTLTKLRDTMLPKLISGEVRLKDIAQTIANTL